MVKKCLFYVSIVGLLLNLNACKAENVQTIRIDNHLPPLQKIPLATKNVRQIATDNNHLFVINDKGELWQNNQKLSENFSTKFLPIARQAKLATANTQGFLTIWTEKQTYHSTILLSPNSGLAWDNDCVIAIQQQERQTYPVRACVVGDNIEIQAKRQDIHSLPDARPIVYQDKIAILANPDSETYKHGVLGDKIEARSLYVLTGNNLKDVFTPIHLNKQVFEHNQVQMQNNQLATVVAGQGNGAKVVVFDAQTGKILAESSPLPTNRWQSPFAFAGQWYAVKMPHILGHLVHYQQKGQQLLETKLAESVSNHAFGSYHTQTAVALVDNVLIPNIAYRQIVVLDKHSTLYELSPILPARIILGVAQGNNAYWLLENGEVWGW